MFAGGLSTGNMADGASQFKFSFFGMCLCVRHQSRYKRAMACIMMLIPSSVTLPLQMLLGEEEQVHKSPGKAAFVTSQVHSSCSMAMVQICSSIQKDALYICSYSITLKSEGVDILNFPRKPTGMGISLVKP